MKIGTYLISGPPPSPHVQIDGRKTQINECFNIKNLYQLCDGRSIMYWLIISILWYYYTGEGIISGIYWLAYCTVLHTEHGVSYSRDSDPRCCRGVYYPALPRNEYLSSLVRFHQFQLQLVDRVVVYNWLSA